MGKTLALLIMTIVAMLLISQLHIATQLKILIMLIVVVVLLLWHDDFDNKNYSLP